MQISSTRCAFAVAAAAICDPAELRQAGLVEIGLPGYYAADLQHLRGWPARANVPVIGLRIGTTIFSAQVDTGFADEIQPGMVQVNAALLAALLGGVAMRSVEGPPTMGCSRESLLAGLDEIGLTLRDSPVPAVCSLR